MFPVLRTLSRYRAYFAGLRIPFGISIGCSIAKGAAAAFFALSLRRLLDGLGAGGTFNTAPLGMAILLALIISLLGVGTRFAVSTLTQTALQRLRMDMVRKILLLTPEDVGRHGRARIQSLVLRDTDVVDRMANTLLAYAIPAAISTAALAIILLVIAPLLGIATLLIAGLLWLAARAHKNAIERNASAFAAHFAALNRGILLTLERLALVRSAGLENLEQSQRQHDIAQLGEVGSTTDRSVGVIAETLVLLGNLATIGLLTGGLLLVGGMVDLPSLLSIYLVLLLMRAQASIVGAALPDVRMGIASLHRLSAFLDLPTSAPYAGTTSFSFRGNVRLENVSFSYSDAPLLQDINLVLAPGTCTVITGANGTGKTTLIHLILGTLKPLSGAISAEALAYSALDFSILREAISFLPQEPIIFDGSVEENISYGRPQATRRDIERAARLAGAEGLIQAYSQGRSVAVGDNGVLLSGGERQRIALARALVGRPQLLIMDEPTNHLDGAAVAALLPMLRAQEHAPAILIISHERALTSAADKVFELQDGVLKQWAVPSVPTLIQFQTAHEAGSHRIG